MAHSRRPVLLALVALAGASCREAPQPGDSRGSTTPRYERAEAPPLAGARRPVPVGELGPSLAACPFRGSTRRAGAGREAEPLPVRAAPYQAAEIVGWIAPGEEFRICARTHDQHWFGVVQGGAQACGVSRPIPEPQDYAGPCPSGWVASLDVRVGR